MGRGGRDMETAAAEPGAAFLNEEVQLGRAEHGLGLHDERCRSRGQRAGEWAKENEVLTAARAA
eukprot:3574890-Pleurochrysis_carterae.AAC.6